VIEPPASSLGLSVWVRLIKAYNLVLRDVRRSIDPDLTLPQFDLLSQLARHEDGATPAELSRYLLVTAGNLTGIIDRLEEQGLVDRVPEPGDRRKTRLRLTRAGRDRVRRMQPRHAADLETILAAVSREDQRAMRDLLGRFNAALERPSAKTAPAGRPHRRDAK
jgi:DNA-binding MarR family transcriptional regulator